MVRVCSLTVGVSSFHLIPLAPPISIRLVGLSSGLLLTLTTSGAKVAISNFQLYNPLTHYTNTAGYLPQSP